MKLQVVVTSYEGAPLPAGCPVRVELRDTSVADAPAVLVHQAKATVPARGRTSTIELTIKVAAVPDGTTAWAHIDVDRDGRVSKGDYVCVESYPVANLPIQSLAIRVKKVT
jgi:uncharacterized lipoprotein YbaY